MDSGRLLKMMLVALATAAVVVSLPDIKRYIKMSMM